MAYIIGMVDKEELAALNAAGWEDEDPPASMLPVGFDPIEGDELRMFWVDNDVYSVMSGPDWEPVPHTPDCALEYTVILLRPDYIADEFGKDVFHTFVMAHSADDAVCKAQEAAADADDSGGGCEPDDYYPLFVCRGRVPNLINY